MRYPTILITCLLQFACASTPTENIVEDYEKQLQERYSNINYADGIDPSEATTLVEVYTRKHMSASFGYTGPFDANKYWLFKITGDPAPIILDNLPPILVHKKTGEVTWDAKPPIKK